MQKFYKGFCGVFVYLRSPCFFKKTIKTIQGFDVFVHSFDTLYKLGNSILFI